MNQQQDENHQDVVGGKLPWFRFYSEVLHDPKVQRLPLKLYKFWTSCMCFACENDGKLPKHQDISWVLRIDEDECLKMLKALKDAHLLDDVGSGIMPHNWNKRQFKSDCSTDRVRRSRERAKERSAERYGNVSVTRSETDTEQSRADTYANGVSANVSTQADSGNYVPRRWGEYARKYPTDRFDEVKAKPAYWHKATSEEAEDEIHDGLDRAMAGEEWSVRHIIPSASKFIIDEKFKLTYRTVAGGMEVKYPEW